MTILLAGILLSIHPALSMARSAPATEPGANETSSYRFDDFLTVLAIKEPIHLILVEKSRQRLLVLKHDGTLSVAAEYLSATGEAPGMKQESGDLRTPEGIYFITTIFEDNKISIFGKRALHLDYPNVFDKNAGRGGDGIYIHGTNKKLQPNSSNGCITLKNKDLDELTKYMAKVVTPVVIVDEIGALQRPQTEDPIKNKAELERAVLPDSINPENVSFDYLYLINLGNQSVAVGEFDYALDSTSTIHGYSRGYLELEDGKWHVREKAWDTTPVNIYPQRPLKIAVQRNEPVSLQVAQLSGPVKKPSQGPSAAAKPDAVKTPHPVEAVPPAARQTETRMTEDNARAPQPSVPEKEAAGPARPAAPQPASSRDEKAVLDFLEKWRLAWQSKNIDDYIDKYDGSFKQDGKNLAAWKKYKDSLNRQYTFIKVDIRDVDIQWAPDGATVSFAQAYQSDKYHAQGRKTLLLRHKDGKWSITRELWAKQ